MLLSYLLSFLLLWNHAPALAFHVPTRPTRPTSPALAKYFQRKTALHLATSSSSSNDTTSNPVDELSDERKANLFQFLLRDLQVEGIPLLAVDADQVDTLQAAMFTTLAELCDQPGANKACMVFEDLSVDALRTFVDDFMLVKSEERLISILPELERVNVSLVGKGVGPAILIDVGNVTAENHAATLHVVEVPEPQVSAAVKAFFGRMAEKTDPHPYQMKGTPTSFKLCRRSDAAHILSSFWNCLCELRATDEDALGTSVLMLPGIHEHERFTATSELLSRSLCLFQGDNKFDLVHFFPEYDRSKVYPADQPTLGHIPPISWLPSMLRSSNKDDDDPSINQLSEEDWTLTNYQRRSPVTAVAIKRVSLMKDNEATQLTLDNGEKVSARGVYSYAKNAEFLAAEGKAALDVALAKEKSILE